MHNDLQYFNFYDVLTLMCRHACESQFYIDQVQDLDDIKQKILTLAEAEGKEFTDEELNIKANDEVHDLAKKDYEEMIHNINDLSDEIELVSDLRTAADKVFRHAATNISNFQDNRDGYQGYYTSKHLVEIQKLISIMMLRRHQNSAKDKYMLTTKADFKLHKLGRQRISAIIHEKDTEPVQAEAKAKDTIPSRNIIDGNFSSSVKN